MPISKKKEIVEFYCEFCNQKVEDEKAARRCEDRHRELAEIMKIGQTVYNRFVNGGEGAIIAHKYRVVGFSDMGKVVLYWPAEARTFIEDSGNLSLTIDDKYKHLVH